MVSSSSSAGALASSTPNQGANRQGQVGAGGAAADDPRDKTIKGPALASASHTLQLVVLLSVNTVLVLLSLWLLPSHLIWRQARKTSSASALAQATVGEQPPSSPLATSMLSDVALDGSSESFFRNLSAALSLLFGLPSSDRAGAAWIRRSYRSALAATFLAQGWFVARFKGWWDEAEAMDRGDREEVLKRRRVGIGKQMEGVTLTSFALPLPMLALFAIAFLLGAPLLTNPLDGLVASFYLATLALLPAVHLLGTDVDEWCSTFSAAAFASDETKRGAKRFRLLSTIVYGPLLGGFIGSAGMLLDWDKAWQAFPIPTILGASMGLAIGNGIAMLTYWSSLPKRTSTTPTVERKALSKTSSSEQQQKKKKNKRR
ncbi:hypothetical protein FA10DRAFT_268530 [Acaromyces ingoldii]|uniref:Uncharacterized protein n=1 Tax=Acaromyces ingoldii TaxID=215250 RepID=A0A316YGR9_9BASI|nr:hypothetical protein FA10DRAFT_268530 [Acaromyces ingoldii]PWN88331.1 hypothetical protein FA10DRAFT_268530 [Acaromyces ingoldii]